jgi:hypothetical protein
MAKLKSYIIKVAVPGTPVNLAEAGNQEAYVGDAMIQPLRGNTGSVLYGGPEVDALAATPIGIDLDPLAVLGIGDLVVGKYNSPREGMQLKDHWIDAANANDGVCVTIFE